MTSEIKETSLLIIAFIFTGAGGVTLADNPITGSVLLLIAVGILVLKAWLKSKGIQTKK